MRLYDIALFIACFSAVLGVLNDSEYFTASVIPMEDISMTKADFNIATSDTTTEKDAGGVIETYNMIKRTLGVLMTVLLRVGWIYDILMSVFATGLNPGSSDYSTVQKISALIQSVIWIIYAIGLYQLWTKSSIRYME